LKLKKIEESISCLLRHDNSRGKNRKNVVRRGEGGKGLARLSGKTDVKAGEGKKRERDSKNKVFLDGTFCGGFQPKGECQVRCAQCGRAERGGGSGERGCGEVSV